MANYRIDTDPDIPEDDPGWDRPAVLVLENGQEIELPDVTVRDAAAFLRTAFELEELIGGEIDPRRVRSIGPKPEEE
jgi:hypothetical protein